MKKSNTQAFLTQTKSTSWLSTQNRLNMSIHSPKSNCANTLQFYTSKDQDYVSKLNFGLENKNKRTSTSSAFNPFNQVTTAISTKYMAILEIMSDQNMKKKQNLINEKCLENKLNILANQIDLNQKKLKEYYNKCNIRIKLIEDLKLELDVINNFEHYSQFGDKFSKISTQSDFCQKMSYRDFIKTQLGKMVKIGREKEFQLVKNKNEHKECINEIKRIEEEMKEQKEMYRNAKETLIEHLHKVLEEGRDTRKDGLSWIIQKIWRFNEEVILSYLPKFLDEKAIDFLFILSTLDWTKEKMKEELAHINGILSKSYSFPKNILNENSKTNLNIIPKRKTIKGKDIIVYVPVTPQENSSSFRDIIGEIDTSKKISLECNALLAILQEKEKAIGRLKKEMKELKKRELSRVCMEFYKYDYERRYNTSMNIVLSALIGEDYSALDVSRQSKEMQVFIKSIHQLKKSHDPDLQGL